jgi:hypothetical protein
MKELKSRGLEMGIFYEDSKRSRRLLMLITEKSGMSSATSTLCAFASLTGALKWRETGGRDRRDDIHFR